MLEQETASIIRFVLNSAGNPFPYYEKIPESFAVPAAYFPTPEIVTGGETFCTYAMEYAWYILFFHKNENEAYALALQALTAIRRKRNLIPLIDTDGNKTGKGIRLKDPDIKVIDNGAAQLHLRWTSRRPYACEEATKMQTYQLEERST